VIGLNSLNLQLIVIIVTNEIIKARKLCQFYVSMLQYAGGLLCMNRPSSGIHCRLLSCYVKIWNDIVLGHNTIHLFHSFVIFDSQINIGYESDNANKRSAGLA